jgi:hypothetical protein
VSTKEQLGHAKLLMGAVQDAVEAITTKQEGERRAHGLRLQHPAGDWHGRQGEGRAGRQDRHRVEGVGR